MFRTEIEIYADPTLPPVSVTHQGTVGEWLVERYGADGLPHPFHLFREQMCLETLCNLDDPASWADSDGKFCVALADPPAGPIVPFIPYIIAALAVVASFVFMPKVPAVNTGRSQQSSNNSLDKRSNEPRVNQRIEDIFGDERTTLSLITVPATKFVNGTEYEEFVGGVGRGSYQFVESPRDGTTPFTTIAGAGFSAYAPFTGPNAGDAPQQSWGDEVSYRIKTVASVGAVVGGTLTPPQTDLLSISGATVTTGGLITMPSSYEDDLTDIYKAGDTLVLTDCWFGEPTTLPAFYLRSAAGSYVVESVTTNTITLNVAGNPAWAWATSVGLLVSCWMLPGQPVADGELAFITDPGGSTPPYVEVTLKPTFDSTTNRTVGPFVVMQKDSEVFRYNLVASNGLYRDNGTVYPLTASIQLTIEQMSDANTPTGLTHVETFDVTGYKNDPYGWTFEFPNPYPGSITRHSMLRTSASPSNKNQAVVDDIKWRDLFTYVDDCPDHFGDITIALVRVKATESALKVKDRVANARVIRMIPAAGQGWDTTLYPLTDMVSIASALARDPRIGRLSASQFDVVHWQIEQQRIVDYFGDEDMVKPVYTFDDTNMTYEESTQLIAQACFCQAYRQGSVVRCVADLPQSQSSLLFCHRNKHPGSDKENRTFEQDKQQDGVELTYRSRLTDASETYILDDAGGSNPSVPKEVERLGIRTEKQAVIHARRIVNRLKYARRRIQFDALSDGRLAIPSQRVDIVSNVESGTMDGEVRGVSGLTLRLSQPVAMGSGAHSIILSRRDGTTQGIPVTAVSADGYSVTLSSAPSEAVYSGYMEDRTRFWFGADNEQDALAWLVEEVSPDSLDKVGITAVNYSDGYYAGDLLPV